jgi:hypothetical protein
VNDKKLTVAQYLTAQISLSNKTQKEIAEACGWQRPNMVTMVKQGASRLPINKIGPLAKALSIDPVHLLRLAMSEYMPETWEAVEEIWGDWVLASAEEMEIVRLVRKHIGDAQIDLRDPRLMTMLKDALDAFAAQITVAHTGQGLTSAETPMP